MLSFSLVRPVVVRNLTKKFGSTVAVDGVSLDIPAGALFFLLGPSGCGKTTLLRMIAGFTEPTAGEIRFGDRDVTFLPPNLRNCGMVFQSYALWPHMTVAKNVEFGLNVRKVPAAEAARRVAAALASVRMEPYAQRKPNALSGGQQQRVALARALVIEPHVLLLDEPLSNLDAKLRLEMRSEIKRICREANITGIYVTHDQKEALSMADGVAVLHAGKVVQVGPPRQLYDRPRSRFVADFLGETNFLPATVARRDAADLLLDSPAGPLRSTVYPDGLLPGAKVTCSVRPEAIVLSDDAGQASAPSAPSFNCFPADPLESVYLGEVAQHQLRLAGAIVVKAFELNPRRDRLALKQLRVRVEPRDVVVLSDV